MGKKTQQQRNAQASLLGGAIGAGIGMIGGPHGAVVGWQIGSNVGPNLENSGGFARDETERTQSRNVRRQGGFNR